MNEQPQPTNPEYPEILIRKLTKGYFISHIGTEGKSISKAVTTFKEVEETLINFNENVR